MQDKSEQGLAHKKQTNTKVRVTTEAARRILSIIKTERVRQGISQQELADKFEKKRKSISDLEKGRRHATLMELCEIMDILNIKLIAVPDRYYPN